MSAHNQTGALSQLLAPFSDAGVSMTRLESRPARHTLWEYVFFVDIEVTARCARATALAELARRAPI
jgi:chorismate mutase/prephenate dehydratase